MARQNEKTESFGPKAPYFMEDTICALATPPGESALSLIRISGKRAFEAGRRLCPFLPRKIQSHRIYFGRLIHPKTAEYLDEVLVSCFQKGRSFTGEESMEISCHGSAFICSSILEALTGLNVRLAEKGEFSYRAFMNGKMDLVQAEHVLGLIQSRSPKARAQALRGLGGKVSLHLKLLEEKLLKLLSNMEADIDFSDQDIKPFSEKQQKKFLREIQQDLESALKGFEQGRINKEGFCFLLLGAPNAGKSSLFNCFAREEKAIVTKQAGTTRDVLSLRFLLQQREFCVKDTAGFRKAPDPVEQKGMEKALKEAEQADLLVFLVESALPLRPDSFFGLQKLDPKKIILLFSKSDQLSLSERRQFLKQAKTFLIKEKNKTKGAFKQSFSSCLTQITSSKNVLWLSSRSKEGIESFQNFLHKKSEVSIGDIFYSTARQQRALKEIKGFLTKAEKLENASPEFRVFELQSALSVLYRLLGKEYDEEVIKQIFQEFCIGK